MKAYLIIDLNMTNIEGFKEYVQRVPELIQKHGGKYLVQGVEPTVIELAAGQVLDRSVVLEFPDRGAAEAFLAEREESDLHDVWKKTTRSRILLVDGCT